MFWNILRINIDIGNCSALIKSADLELSKSHGPSKFIKFLSSKCITLFTCAKSVLEDVCRKIEASTVSLHELSLMKERADDVRKLLAINFHGKEVERFHDILDEKFIEYALFWKRMERLGLLCQHIDIKVKGEIIIIIGASGHVYIE